MEQLLPRRFSSRSDGPTGYTLVEVVVAMLISCVIITAVFGVALTSKQGSGEGMRRVLANSAAAQVSAQLKAYVTACCNPTTGTCPGAGCVAAGQGPNTLNVTSSWAISAPLAAPPVVDSATPPAAGTCATGASRNIWALTCGTHYLTGINPTIEAAPYCGYVEYTVTWPGGCPNPLPPAQGSPNVAFTVNWTEP